MSLWNMIQRLSPDVLSQIYGDTFPIEVRHYLSVWIEDNVKQWSKIEVDNPSHAPFASVILKQLVAEIEKKSTSFSSQEQLSIRLRNAAEFLLTRYQNNPLELIATIGQCLERENHVLNHCEVKNTPARLENKVDSGITICQLTVLKTNVHDAYEDFRILAPLHESFINQFRNRQQIIGAPGMDLLEMNGTVILNRWMNLHGKHKIIINVLTSVEQVLLDELCAFEMEQQMAGNGKPIYTEKLDQIEEWCQTLAEIIGSVRCQVKECDRYLLQMPYMIKGYINLLPRVNELLSSLVIKAFVIEKQPPQVLKTHTTFVATVRLLVQNQENITIAPSKVSVTIINESQAQSEALLQSSTDMKIDSGVILNNTGKMECKEPRNSPSVTLRMSLRKIRRAEKRGKAVTDEKFCLLFESTCNINEGEMIFPVRKLSLPVVVVVAGNQEPQAWATVTWDNAFAKAGRVPFHITERVAWPQIAEMLNIKFTSFVGKSLSSENLKFIASKIFKTSQSSDYSQMFLTWSQFCKEPLTSRSFTFWDWFYGIIKITRQFLRAIWCDGSIMGFVDKDQVEDKLKNCSSGTFLVRFSESSIGGVTMAWVYEDSNRGIQRKVFMSIPFTSKDLAIRSLADRVADLSYFTCLYPNKPKTEAFGKYYTPVTFGNPVGGYVETQLISVVEGFPGSGSNIFSLHGLQGADSKPLVNTNSVIEPRNDHGEDDHQSILTDLNTIDIDRLLNDQDNSFLHEGPFDFHRGSFSLQQGSLNLNPETLNLNQDFSLSPATFELLQSMQDEIIL